MSHHRRITLIAALTLLPGCAVRSERVSDDRALRARAEIERVIRSAKEANRRKDIDAFMAPVDTGFVLESNEAADVGRHIARDTLRRDILRDWSIIGRMYEVEQWVDSIALPSPDTAIVFTNQFYHRTFLRPGGRPGEDDVVTTQKHREVWIKRAEGWKQLRIRELGGAIYVNGKPYSQ
jgi:hypothetical protein